MENPSESDQVGVEIDLDGDFLLPAGYQFSRPDEALVLARFVNKVEAGAIFQAQGIRNYISRGLLGGGYAKKLLASAFNPSEKIQSQLRALSKDGFFLVGRCLIGPDLKVIETESGRKLGLGGRPAFACAPEYAQSDMKLDFLFGNDEIMIFAKEDEKKEVEATKESRSIEEGAE